MSTNAKVGGKTSFWVIINMDDKSVQCIGINRDGIITAATSYGRHVFDNSTTMFLANKAMRWAESGGEGWGIWGIMKYWR